VPPVDHPVEARLRPLLLTGGGHRQTLLGYFLPSEKRRYSARRHVVELPDGDILVLHDDCPSTWGPGSPFAILMHGLAGCHGSNYMVRIAGQLADRGVRVFRLDHRGSGAAAEQARLPYHAGRSDDVRAAFDAASHLCPGSLGGIAGFSLSGNMLLKMLGEDGRSGRRPNYLACAVAVNPPIDLELCSQALQRGFNRIYDRHFTKLLLPQVEQRLQSFPDAPRPVGNWPPHTLREFDNQYTAPASGFDGVEHYYSKSSAAQFVPDIDVPTLIVTADDDPLIPVRSFRELPAVAGVQVEITSHGGHLGYLSRPADPAFRRWMDWRVVTWLAEHLRF
jgi:predicted alpha/beta-fold hydrolase